MKSIKERIVEYLLKKVDEQDKVSKKSPVGFTTKELADKLDEYRRSISREVSALRKMGVLNCELLNKQRGIYMLQTDGKFTRKIFEEHLEQSRIKLEQSKKKRSTTEVRKILNGLHKHLQETSSTS